MQHFIPALLLLLPYALASQLVLPLRIKPDWNPVKLDISTKLRFGIGISLHKRLLGLNVKAPLLDLGIDLGDDQGKSLDLNLDRLLSPLLDHKWQMTTSRLINSNSDTAWFAEISFGTPKQTLQVDIDSGSADTVLFDSACITCNGTLFDHSESSTFVRSTTTFQTEYADGTRLSGMMARDTTHLTDTLPITSQLLAIIMNRTGKTHSAWDGVMGIGPDRLSFVENNVTPLSDLVKQGKLDQPLVGILLIKKTTVSEGGGEYRWGGINSGYVMGSIVYTPVTSSFYWGLDVQGVYVKDKRMQGSGRAIIDTGTTLVYVSTAAATAIHAAIPGAIRTDFYYVPCHMVLIPTNVFFEIQGHRWGIPAGDLAFRPSGKNDGLCLSGIQGGSDSFMVLGGVFIKNHYLILNYGDTQKYKLSIGLSNRTDIPPIL